MLAATMQTIDMHMSPLPITIDPSLRLDHAMQQMSAAAIGHLVIEGDGIRGVLSAAEIRVALRLDRDAVARDVLEPEPLCVPRDTKPDKVLVAMRERRASGVLVVDGERIVGILTTTDVIRWLELAIAADAGPTPEEIRGRILAEHTRIRSELDHIETIARRVVRGSQESTTLRERVRVLEGILRGHLDLEERLVLPWLREADGFGPERARLMEEEHAEQRATLDGIIDGLFTTRSVTELAVRTLELCTALRDDIATEERSFLTDDGPLARFVTGGFGG